MTTTHKASLFLSGAAFLLFVINQGVELAGYHFSLEGTLGAFVLTGFLAAGLIIQVSKLIEGHRTRMDLLITFVQLVMHVIAEIAIWMRTQIMGLSLPVELPLYLVGLYWVSGLADVFFRYIGRELKLFAGSYRSPETLLRESLETEKARSKQIEDDLNQVKQTLMLVEERLTTAQQQVEDGRGQVEQRDRKIEQLLGKIEQREDDRNQRYELPCGYTDCDWTTGLKSTILTAEKSLSSHYGRKHGGVPATNGHKQTSAARHPDAPAFSQLPADGFK